MADLAISRAARDDLRSIRHYSRAAFGLAIARRYLQGIDLVFRHLREHPMMGASEPDLGGGIRSLGYRSHRIFYQVNADSLLIVRVLHGAQDSNRLTGGGSHER